ncbi:Uncharacterized protein Adt_32698 [Abeliophyllum distichum]|uniref:Uncharacterized protein n=1 Tax=Abeliophyllum distichum TaxID=126358 RepID=A0ABD1QU56_9LAMI
MDIQTWRNSRSKTIHIGRSYDKLENQPTRSTTTKQIWKVLWRKLLKDKKKKPVCSVHVNVPYDAYTYSQNFDQGLTWDEPDHLSRSFSVRFANSQKRDQR